MDAGAPTMIFSSSCMSSPSFSFLLSSALKTADADIKATATKKPKEFMSLRPLISMPKRSLTA